MHVLEANYAVVRRITRFVAVAEMSMVMASRATILRFVLPARIATMEKLQCILVHLRIVMGSIIIVMDLSTRSPKAVQVARIFVALWTVVIAMCVSAQKMRRAIVAKDLVNEQETR